MWASLDNARDLEPADPAHYQWGVKLKCEGCQEESGKWRYVSLDERLDVPNSRGQANHVEKCKLCGKQSWLSEFFMFMLCK